MMHPDSPCRQQRSRTARYPTLCYAKNGATRFVACGIYRRADADTQLQQKSIGHLRQLELENRDGAHGSLLAAGEVGAVTPALRRIECGIPQERRSTDDAYGSDVAVAVDIGFYLHVSLYMCVGSSLWVSRCGAVEDIGRIHPQRDGADATARRDEPLASRA